MAQLVKNLPAMQETWVRSLGWVGKICWRRERLLTPVFWPGEVHEQRSLVGFSLWGHRESDTTERLSHMDTCVASLVAQIVKNLPAMQ